MSFLDLYQKQFSQKKNFLCVGLDPDRDKIPMRYMSAANPILAFNQDIIEKTSPYAIAYKPNMAFYEVGGDLGMKALEETIALIRSLQIPVILDAKRGDIDNTAKFYARTIFEGFQADATTLAPYMGFDSILPFVEYKDKVSFVLGLTSNKSAQDFEMLELKGGKKLYEAVLDRMNEKRNEFPNIGYVIGATQEEELKSVALRTKGVPLLIPGVGSQGGSLEGVIANLYQDNPLLINLSRAILYAEDPGQEARKVAQQMRALIEK